jgi:hypothetical protein
MTKARNPSSKVSNKAVGDRLEDAVELIERQMLREYESQGKVTFERNKVAIIDGARYEADLLVGIRHPVGYETTYLFECKNWKRVAGKNEVVKVNDAIEAFGAQRGYLVAKRFSKDAKAKQHKCPRVLFLLASEMSTLIPHPFVRTITMLASAQIRATFSVRLPDEEEAPPLTPTSVVRHGGVERMASDWLQPIANAMIAAGRGKNTGPLAEGKHLLVEEETYGFKKGELFVDGYACAGVRIHVEQPFWCAPATTSMKFAIEGRGEAVQLKSTIHNWGEVTLSLVSTSEKQ